MTCWESTCSILSFSSFSMRTDENIGLDFTFTLLKSALENYFQHILATTSIQAPNFEYYLSEFTKQAQEQQIAIFQQRNGFMVWVVLDPIYSKPIWEWLEDTTLELPAKTIVHTIFGWNPNKASTALSRFETPQWNSPVPLILSEFGGDQGCSSEFGRWQSLDTRF